jgi:NADH:ubiquinone oxidoreductase subunit
VKASVSHPLASPARNAGQKSRLAMQRARTNASELQNSPLWTILPQGGISMLIPPNRRLAHMKQFFLKMFTWWNGQTIGTQLWTWRFGELVGQDVQGNRYYRTAGGKIDPVLHFERRWVIYNGLAEASRIPAEWHGWIHHTVDVPPTQDGYKPREWEKPHQPNLTGTPLAYRPSGSTLASGRRPKATGDYQAWTP